MRIGIITLNTHTNYGGILQAYALHTVLARQGHDVQVIYMPVRFKTDYRFPLIWVKRCLLKYVFGKDIRILCERYHNRMFPIVSQNTQRFIDKNIKYTLVDRYEDLKEENWDAFVVGSDQIWRPDYCSFPFPNAFLAFAQDWDIKRFAYAASFGSDKWLLSPANTIKCRELAKKFDFITVREKSGVRLCKEYLDVEATHVLDPTLLLDKVDYVKLINGINTEKSEGNLLTYILDDNKEKTDIVNYVSSNLSLKPFRVNSRYEDFSAPLEERIQPSVEQWLKGFNEAEFVVTDSFHACVFSIIFHKPFIAIGNKERGMDRFESLLSMFQLNNRMCLSLKDAMNILKSQQGIKWTAVDKTVSTLVASSLEILKGVNEKL